MEASPDVHIPPHGLAASEAPAHGEADGALRCSAPSALIEAVIEGIHISWWGMLGTLSRIYLDVLFFDYLNITSPSGALFLDWPANVMGSWLVGLVIGLSTEIADEVPLIANFVEYGPQLQVGLQTGFCGCITTYASWNHQMVSILVLSGSQFCVGLAGFVLGLHSIMASYSIGVHNARLVALYVGGTRLAEKHREIGSSRSWSQNASRPSPHHDLPEIASLSQSRRTWTIIVSFLLVLSLAASITGWAVEKEEGKGYWAAVTLSPIGALARWQLGKLYNKRIRFSGNNAPFFPLGTFIANMIASLFRSLIAAIITDSPTELNPAVLAACSGINTGLLGSLSTASTFAAEISKLVDFTPTDLRNLGKTGYYGYLYASVSIVIR
ncbi:hypothetical protein GUITHDRAFT_121800 [Guillardia theta CCMP2712]|uniref:Uncharacterized protein n=1 Tax=Guillardia theta (strain CCMP2712) TaxID=905079 RepID=L1I6Z8_GUITC|nr:hypothetical protein GUITHDRAFT_121800 [Guillardia theta CCMP2712]EKX32033.1 hypothetical protein GUITHDRAFT_121800 [Guillardia theta CCMP2712]|eukprot:XP_005819013.1 hypothetical protein GUITHDRAFT_121800 [Guillardia theta CCMP2712]